MLSKRFPTFIALIRPCSSVHCSVSNEMGFAAKGFPTSTALIRLCSSVNFLVLNKERFLTKRFSTFKSFIRSNQCELSSVK